MSEDMNASLFYTCVGRMRRVCDDVLVNMFINNLCEHHKVGPIPDHEMIDVVNNLRHDDVMRLMMLSIADILSSEEQ